MLSGIGRRLRTAAYVSCWTLGDFESEALWRMYCSRDDGVAVQTRYERLVDVIKDDDELFIGCVTYLDYETQWFPDGNMFYPVMHKRRAFSHENEVRLVKLLTAHLVDGASPGPLSLSVPVKLPELAEGIFISPYALEWYADVVRRIVDTFAPELSDRVHWSQMKSDPLY